MKKSRGVPRPTEETALSRVAKLYKSTEPQRILETFEVPYTNINNQRFIIKVSYLKKVK